MPREEADERRLAALRETLRLYSEAARDARDAPSEEERAEASEKADAFRELARGLVTVDE